MTNPKEPTLTCSEVVERLEQECVDPIYRKYFKRELATQILHSWRERRVQELEKLIAKRSGCSHCADSASGITSANDSSEIRRSK